MKDNKEKHESIAEEFGRTTDPLAEYDTGFKNLVVLQSGLDFAAGTLN